MRAVPWDLDPEHEDDDLPEGVACADWKEYASTVLESVDGQLEAHGLEVVLHGPGGSDTYYWSVEKREEKPDGVEP